MKRFFGVLLSTIVVGLAFFIVGTAFTQPCNGAEITVEVTAEVAQPKLTISPPIPGNMVRPSYPDEVYRMSAGEFYAWATEQNAKARAEWDEWHKTAPPRWISYGVTDYEQSRRGRYFGTNYEKGSARSYEKRFLNPDYVARPLTIINPYCQPPARRCPAPVFPVW